jgi:hypothetical protein
VDRFYLEDNSRKQERENEVGMEERPAQEFFHEVPADKSRACCSWDF